MNQPFWMYYGHQDDQPRYNSGHQAHQMQTQFVPNPSLFPTSDPVNGTVNVNHGSSSPLLGEEPGSCQPSNPTYIVGVKVLSQSNKKDFKLYTLRGVVENSMKKPDTIKNEIFEQLGDEVVSESLDFDLGYYVGKEKKWINNVSDASDAVEILKSQKKLTLWCTGVQERKKRDRRESDTDDEAQVCLSKRGKYSSAIKSKEAERNNIVSELRERHGTAYSAVQYRLWAEMKIAGTWSSLEEVPPYPMFGQKKHRGLSASGELNEALTGLAKSISVALSPQPSTSHGGSTATRSPTKTANLRSKYMEQLSDLVKLREIGALSNEEYEDQRQVIVDSMRRL